MLLHFKRCFGGILLRRINLALLPLLPVLVPCAAAAAVAPAPAVVALAAAVAAAALTPSALTAAARAQRGTVRQCDRADFCGCDM